MNKRRMRFKGRLWVLFVLWTTCFFSSCAPLLPLFQLPILVLELPFRLLAITFQLLPYAIRYAPLALLLVERSDAEYDDVYYAFADNGAGMVRLSPQTDCFWIDLTEPAAAEELLRFAATGQVRIVFLKDRSFVCSEKELAKIYQGMKERQVFLACDPRLVQVNQVGGKDFFIPGRKIEKEVSHG